jgi:hypothetical protein
MNKSWPEAREYDTIPEKEERKRSPDMPIEILHNGSRQTLRTHQTQKPFAKRVVKNTSLQFPANRTSFGASYRKCGRAAGSVFRARARASRGSAQFPSSLQFVKVIPLSGGHKIRF